VGWDVESKARVPGSIVDSRWDHKEASISEESVAITVAPLIGSNPLVVHILIHRCGYAKTAGQSLEITVILGTPRIQVEVEKSQTLSACRMDGGFRSLHCAGGGPPTRTGCERRKLDPTLFMAYRCTVVLVTMIPLLTHSRIVLEMSVGAFCEQAYLSAEQSAS